MFEKLRAFRRGRDGTSAVEFALIAPFLMVLMLGGFDTARYAIAVRNLSQTANSIAQMVSVNTSGTISADELQFYQDSAMVTFPQVLQDSAQQGITWAADMGSTVSLIRFVNVSTGLVKITVGNVVWSVGTATRPCATPIIATTDDATPTPTTLPADAIGVGTMIVVDLTYTFRPTIGSKYLKPVKIVRSYYMQPRYVDVINFATANLQNGKICSVL